MADDRPASVGLLGGGVIGAGWAARFLVHGVDVRLYDPDPGAAEKAEAVVAARSTSAPLEASTPRSRNRLSSSPTRTLPPASAAIAANGS